VEPEEIEELARLLASLHAKHTSETQPLWEALGRKERSLWRLLARTALAHQPTIKRSGPARLFEIGSRLVGRGSHAVAAAPVPGAPKGKGAAARAGKSRGGPPRPNGTDGRIGHFLRLIRRGRGKRQAPHSASPAPPQRPAYVPQRVVIYTAVIGGYDELTPPMFQSPDCDFIAFSDVPLRVKGWQVRPLNYLHHDPARAARFVKLHPHVYFPDHDYSIWIDGSIAARGDLRQLVGSLTIGTFIGAFPHPARDCIYEQGENCAVLNQDLAETIERHLARFRMEGVPEKAGLWATNVLVRRHNDPACADLMAAWWRELEIGSRRDELSLPVVARRHSVTISPLGNLAEVASKRELFSHSEHLKVRAITGIASPPAAARVKVHVDSIPIDIGVCVYNSPVETEACLTALAAVRRPNQRIVIVDDASDGPTARYLDQFAVRYPQIQLIRHERNQGYTSSANDVLKNSQGQWVILLNSDTIVPSRALGKLVACGEQFAGLGIVGPLSNTATWQTVPQLSGPDGKWMVNQIPKGVSVEDMDRMCEQVSTRVVPFVPLVNGFCLAIRRAVFDRIGLFDEKNFPIGYGEEDDYCLRAGTAGFLCAIATDAYIYHARSASFTPERRPPLVEAGALALRRKHTPERIASAVDMMKRHPEFARMRERLAEALAARQPAGDPLALAAGDPVSRPRERVELEGLVNG
jgi:GT2 family glycosyltransferase